MRWFRIRPVDALFFRRPGPFSAGGVFVAETLDYPPIMPFVGAFRAEAARSLGLSPTVLRQGHELLGGPNNLGRLAFVGPFLEREGDLYLPLPSSLGFAEKALRPAWAVPKAFLPGENASLPEGFAMLRFPPGYKPLEKSLLKENIFLDLLAGKKIPPAASVKKASASLEEFLYFERRVGVGLDPQTRTAREGLLYSLSLLRLPEKVSFVVGVSGLPEEFPKKGVLPLGGEGRVTCYEERLAPGLFAKRPAPKTFAGQKLLALVLVSPGVFRHGALPRLPHLPGARIIGAVTGKATAVSGWDIARNRPRPLYRAVPPGAVYWVELEAPLGEKEAQAFLENFWGKPLSEDEGSYPFRQAGFGLVFPAKLPTDGGRS